MCMHIWCVLVVFFYVICFVFFLFIFKILPFLLFRYVYFVSHFSSVLDLIWVNTQWINQCVVGWLSTERFHPNVHAFFGSFVCSNWKKTKRVKQQMEKHSVHNRMQNGKKVDLIPNRWFGWFYNYTRWEFDYSY